MTINKDNMDSITETNQNFSRMIKNKEASDTWDSFKKYKGIIPYDIDAKAELALARDEKYADFHSPEAESDEQPY